MNAMIGTITEQRMRQIAAEIIGTYINVDGAYGGQCWDSATYINEHYFGLPRINTGNTAQKSGRWPGWAGNMVDCFPQSEAIAEAYELVPPDLPVLPGDTLVWDDSNHVWYPATHVATAVVDTGRGWVLTLSQNSSASRPDLPGYSPAASGPVIYQTLPKEGLLGIIRPRTSAAAIGGTITSQSSTTTSSEDGFLMAMSEESQAALGHNAYLAVDALGRVEKQNRAILETLALVLPAVARIDTRAAEEVDVNGRLEKNQALLLESQAAVERMARTAAQKA